MTFEIIVALIGLAIAIAQVVGEQGEKRRRTAKVGIFVAAALLVALGGYEFFKVVYHQSELQQIANKVNGVLDHPKTFDDVYEAMNFPDFNKLNEAIDWMYDRTIVKYDVHHGVDVAGKPHSIRLLVRTGP